MKHLILIVIIGFSFFQTAYTQDLTPIVISNENISCSEQPYVLRKLVEITMHNVTFQPSCSNINETNYSEITSAKFIHLTGNKSSISDPGLRISNTVAHFAYKAPYEDVFVKADRDLQGEYIPVASDLRFIYSEEYLDNVPLKFKVYKYKGDNNSYSCNNGEYLVKRGDNYITIPLTGLPIGLYVLEIEDQKGVLYFVRFKKL